MLKSYRITRAESDRWGGDWVGEAFRKHAITVTASAKPKSELYGETLPLLNAGRCSLLDNQRLISQLCGLERRTSRGQNTTKAMMSLGSDARLRTPSLRSLNCLPQSRHRNRR